jgi:hypothetical protein
VLTPSLSGCQYFRAKSALILRGTRLHGRRWCVAASQYGKKLQNAADLDWIFPSENSEAPLRHEDVLSRKIQPKARELGLPHVTWRMLRK